MTKAFPRQNEANDATFALASAGGVQISAVSAAQEATGVGLALFALSAVFFRPAVARGHRVPSFIPLP